jgi:hypothetical protein
MINFDRILVRFIIALTMVAFSCSVALALHAADKAGQHPKADQVRPPVCPDVSSRGFANIKFTTIVALQADGIRGLPCDAEAENNKTKDARSLQHGFDYYSWLTFLALNSPASGAPIGADAPTVWETYKQLPDVMRAKGEAPEPWVESQTNPLVGANRQLPLAGCPNADGKMIVHMNMEETYNQPFRSGPLFDQNGNYAVFVIFMNQTMFDYIAQNTLFTREGQKKFPERQEALRRDPEIDFPGGNNGNGTVGAIMIKASWKLMTKEDLAKRSYHVIDGLLYRGSSTCIPVKLGLIGFHVGHKTDSRQQWIWTTFEHNDNVPTEQEIKDGIPKGRTFSFYDPGQPERPVNQTPDGPWGPDERKWDLTHPSDFKSQIVRTGINTNFHDGVRTTLEDDVKTLNETFQKSPQLEGTVWKNYNLITTQWPSGFPCAQKKHPGGLPDPTCTPFPTFLANSTLETFSQPLELKPGKNDPGLPLATSSCISCHNNATTRPIHSSTMQAARSDFTYILEKACSTDPQENEKQERCK